MSSKILYVYFYIHIEGGVHPLEILEGVHFPLLYYGTRKETSGFQECTTLSTNMKQSYSVACRART